MTRNTLFPDGQAVIQEPCYVSVPIMKKVTAYVETFYDAPIRTLQYLATHVGRIISLNSLRMLTRTPTCHNTCCHAEHNRWLSFLGNPINIL